MGQSQPRRGPINMRMGHISQKIVPHQTRSLYLNCNTALISFRGRIYGADGQMASMLVMGAPRARCLSSAGRLDAKGTFGGSRLSCSFSQRRVRQLAVTTRAEGAVLELKSVEDYDAFLADSGDSLAIVDFYTSWCGPCKLIAPKVEAMAEELSNVRFAKLNLETCPGQFAKDRGIKSLPTFFVMKKVRVVGCRVVP
jgi:thioredoxin 1